MNLARLASLSALLGALALACGCVSYQPKPVALDQSAAALDSRSLANADLRQFLATNLGRDFVKWPLKTWDFETPTWAAFYYHPSLDVARAQWAVATAGRPNPTVGVAPGYNFNAASAVSPWIVGCSFDVPIETMGKRAKRISRAAHLADAARLNIATAAWQVRGALRVALARVPLVYLPEQRRRVQRRVTQPEVMSVQKHLLAMCAPQFIHDGRKPVLCLVPFPPRFQRQFGSEHFTMHAGQLEGDKPQADPSPPGFPQHHAQAAIQVCFEIRGDDAALLAAYSYSPAAPRSRVSAACSTDAEKASASRWTMTVMATPWITSSSAGSQRPPAKPEA